MKNTFLFLLFLCYHGIPHAQTQQEKEQEIRFEINDLYKRNQINCYDQVSAITDIHGKTEFWKVCELENGYRILQIESYKKDIYYQEIYFEREGSLIYAKETENYIPKNHYTQIPWHCQFYAKDEKLITTISHGHGKTETDTWNPEIIFEMHRKRLSELEKIKK